MIQPLVTNILLASSIAGAAVAEDTAKKIEVAVGEAVVTARQLRQPRELKLIGPNT